MHQMEQQRLPPGFRFSPTDEELTVHYLKNKACGRDFYQGVIAEVDIYKHEPWDLPEKSALPSPDPVWYFFNAQDKRHAHSSRINRTTSKGYWKATGKDRKICSGPHTVGTKKTLIYYEGRAPSGKRTDWIMHEYKLDEDFERRSKVIYSPALCRIRKKGGPGPRNGEQYGAPVFNENGEWAEDVDDDIDEKVPLPSSHKSDVVPSCVPDQVKLPKEEVLLETDTEGCASNDLPHLESVDTNTDVDLYTFIETFLADNGEATSLEFDVESSLPVMERTQMSQYNSTCNVNQDVFTPSDVEKLLGLDGTDMHNILHPTCNEEQILGKLLHLTNGSQCPTGIPDCNMMISSQAPTHKDKDSDLHSDGTASISAFGDYIEMNDMNSPLDGFVLRSPSYYSFQQQLPPDLFDEVEAFGGSPDLLDTQGLATRRIRLQIKPSGYATGTCVQQSRVLCNSHTNAPESGGLTIQIDSSSNDNGQKLGKTSSGLGSDSDVISGASSPKSQVIKHMPSSYMVANCKGIQAQSFAATTDSHDEESVALKMTDYINKTKVQPIVSDAVSFLPSLLSRSSCIKEESLDCEAGLGGSYTDDASIYSNHNKQAGLDCEASSSSRVPGEACKPGYTPDDENQEVGQLVSKVKGLTLSSRLVELESNLSNTFNDKVFALGKPVARLFPSRDYMNPYRSLRSGAMASLCRLGVAVLVLFFLFIGIHMLTRYVMFLAA